VEIERIYTIDNGIAQAIDMFIVHGCHPGSCTSLLLQEKFEEAMQHAHPNIRPLFHGEQEHYSNFAERKEKWESHVAYVNEVIPYFVKGENFHTWQGLDAGISDEVGEYILMEKLAGKTYIADLHNKYNIFKELQ